MRSVKAPSGACQASSHAREEIAWWVASGCSKRRRPRTDFCRRHGLATSGGKREISERVETFLRSGRRVRPATQAAPAEPAARTFNQASALAFSLRTRVPAGFKRTQAARRFFETQRLSALSFHCAAAGVHQGPLGHHVRRDRGAMETRARSSQGGTFKPAIALSSSTSSRATSTPTLATRVRLARIFRGLEANPRKTRRRQVPARIELSDRLAQLTPLPDASLGVHTRRVNGPTAPTQQEVAG